MKPLARPHARRPPFSPRRRKSSWTQPEPAAEPVALAPPPEAPRRRSRWFPPRPIRPFRPRSTRCRRVLALQSADLAENMTREILRPMLKAWLDEHLPSLVERLVRAEIQRVARGEQLTPAVRAGGRALRR